MISFQYPGSFKVITFNQERLSFQSQVLCTLVLIKLGLNSVKSATVKKKNCWANTKNVQTIVLKIDEISQETLKISSKECELAILMSILSSTNIM